ncbi:MAG: OmpA family protein, partial [Bacteroidota bacterium]|nr:OmpA family protein [Bacteroidota bacterium]
TTVSDREKAHLEYFANEVDKEKELVIVGSADSKTGSAKRNEFLSNKRAEVVKDLLVKAGFDADKISVESTTDAYDTPVKSRVATVKVK